MFRAFRRVVATSIAVLTVSTAACAAQPAPSVVADGPIAPGAARQVAGTLADALEQLFVVPETGRAYAEAIRAHSAAGDYDALSGRSALAEALTRHVQAVQPEGHFRVFPAAANGSTAPASGAPQPELIEQARMLAPGIAYIRPTIFTGSAYELSQIERFLDQAEAEDARTLIIDMRVHRGGGLAEMDAINRRIFRRSARLLVMDTRTAADQQLPFQESPTLRRAASPAGITRREH
jgi:hypothetical protein